MSISLESLDTRLQSEIHVRTYTINGETFTVPSDYEQIIKDAVDDYSDRNPLRKRTTLSIVNGTATYDLPDDFIRIVMLIPLLTNNDNVLITDSGLIPVDSNTFKEGVVVADNQLTFYPTPTYTTSRYLWYAAAYVLDDDDVYQDMTRAIARVVMIKARALALSLQADKAAQHAYQYAIGDVKIAKEKESDTLAKRAKDEDDDYDKAVKEQIGAVGMPASYKYANY